MRISSCAGLRQPFSALNVWIDCAPGFKSQESVVWFIHKRHDASCTQYHVSVQTSSASVPWGGISNIPQGALGLHSPALYPLPTHTLEAWSCSNMQAACDTTLGLPLCPQGSPSGWSFSNLPGNTPQESWALMHYICMPLCPRCHTFAPLDHQNLTPASQCLACGADGEAEPYSASSSSRRSRQVKPRLQAPHRPLTYYLSDMLQEPGIEQELEDFMWRTSNPNILSSVQDGRICQNLKAHDGTPFFGKADYTDLTIGVVMHYDGCVVLILADPLLTRSWFQPHPSQFSGSHTSGAISFAFVGLGIERRCYLQPNMMHDLIPP